MGIGRLFTFWGKWLFNSLLFRFSSGVLHSTSSIVVFVETSNFGAIIPYKKFIKFYGLFHHCCTKRKIINHWRIITGNLLVASISKSTSTPTAMPLLQAGGYNSSASEVRKNAKTLPTSLSLHCTNSTYKSSFPYFTTIEKIYISIIHFIKPGHTYLKSYRCLSNFLHHKISF